MDNSVSWYQKKTIFKKFSTISLYSLFVWVKALRPSQQFFSHVGYSWVEPVPSNEDESVLHKDTSYTTLHPW